MRGQQHKSKTYPTVKSFQSWPLGCALTGNMPEVGIEGFLFDEDENN